MVAAIRVATIRSCSKDSSMSVVIVAHKTSYYYRVAQLPPAVFKLVMTDYERYVQTPSMSAEKMPLRTYLELIADLPWAIETPDTIDVDKAR